MSAIESTVDDDIKADALKRRIAFIAGVRACADFFEMQPDLEAPWGLMVNISVSDKATMGRYARLTTWAKQYLGDWFSLVKDFGGGVTLELNIARAQVCRKVVTGTQIVPAQPEREVELVEWVCEDALLAPANR